MTLVQCGFSSKLASAVKAHGSMINGTTFRRVGGRRKSTHTRDSAVKTDFSDRWNSGKTLLSLQIELQTFLTKIDSARWEKLRIQDFLSLRNHFPAAQNYHSRYFLSLHLKNELDQPISLGVFPWSWRFYIPKGFKRTFHLFVKKKLLILSKMCNFLVKKGVHWKKMCVLQLRNRSLFRGRNACSASTRHLNGSCVIKVFKH